MDYKIEYYGSQSELEFGKYAGRTLLDISQSDPQYIRWCIVNLSHFYLNPKHDGLEKYLNLGEDEKNILFAKSKLHNQQIAEKYNLGCGEGYGEHEYEDFHMNGEVCIVCGYDKIRPDSNNYNDKGEYATSYDDDSDEVDRWNFEALSGGQLGDYDSFKENGGDVDDLSEYLGH